MIIFEEIQANELNKYLDTQLTGQMTYTEVIEELERTKNNYFYISLNDEDIDQIIKENKEITKQLNLWPVCIMPNVIYVALHQ